MSNDPQLPATKPVVDWAALKVNMPPGYSNTIECFCGATYRSLSKMVQAEGTLVLVTEHPCPGCKREYGHVRRASSDPEFQSIGG